MKVCSECGSPQLVRVYPGCWECAECGCEVELPVQDESLRYGPGNADWVRDFERTSEP
jgi:ribosomal protein L37AE/L43A